MCVCVCTQSCLVHSHDEILLRVHILERKLRKYIYIYLKVIYKCIYEKRRFIFLIVDDILCK